MTSSNANPAPAREVLAALHESLAEAGLGGQVRVGISSPIPRPRAAATPDSSGATGGDRAEEVVYPLDDLLRPLEPPDQGRLIEFSGERSSGRTALAYRLAAGATARGELVGWVDLPHALDPRFLRRSGVDLSGLLWTRPPHARAALRAAELLVRAGFGVVITDLEGAEPRELARLGNAAWSRLLRAVRSTRSTAVILGPERVSGSFSTLGFNTKKCKTIFDRGLFEGLEGRAQVVRNRTGPTDVSAQHRVFHRPRSLAG